MAGFSTKQIFLYVVQHLCCITFLLIFQRVVCNFHEVFNRIIKEIMQASKEQQSMCYYQVRSGGLVKYQYSEFRSEKQKEMDLMRNEDAKATYQGEMSSDSKKRLKQKVEMWYQAVNLRNSESKIKGWGVQRRFVFLTLTLPARQFHSDVTIKKLALKPFLRILREKFHVERYVWRAESQENGNIHFHLILDAFVDKFEVSSVWNKCLAVLGYIDRFKEKHGHCNPPTTKIEVSKSFKGVLNYLVKYISKESQYRRIEGAIWRASQKVLSLQYYEFPADHEIDENVEKGIERGVVSSFVSDRFAVYHMKRENIPLILGFDRWNNYLYWVSLVQMFLFENELVDNFVDYCFLMRGVVDNGFVAQLEIQKTSYPLPRQLEFKNYIPAASFSRR